jgi:hypothetical protein
MANLSAFIQLAFQTLARLGLFPKARKYLSTDSLPSLLFPILTKKNMNEETLASIIAAKAAFEGGAPFGSLTYLKPLKTLKGVETKVSKRATLKVKLCAYSRLKAVREAVEADERESPALGRNLLPESVTPTAIKGVYFATTVKGNRVLCLPDLGPNGKSRYFVGKRNVQVNKFFVQELCLASEFPKNLPSRADLADKGQALFKTVGIENIIDFS